MPDFLSTTGIAYQIEKLLDEADEHISIITPYLKFNRVIFSKLEDATQRGVKVRFVYGKTEISKSDYIKLEALNNLNLYFLKDLHTKCYCHEKKILITSMNLHDYSIRNNFEMGVLFDIDRHNKFCRDSVNEIERIFDEAKVLVQDYNDEYELIPEPELEMAKRLNDFFKTKAFVIKKSNFNNQSSQELAIIICAEDFPKRFVDIYISGKSLEIHSKETILLNELKSILEHGYRVYKNRVYTKDEKIDTQYKLSIYPLKENKGVHEMTFDQTYDYYAQLIKKMR